MEARLMSQSRRFKSRADLSRNDPPLSHRDRLKSPPPGLRHDPPIPDAQRPDQHKPNLKPTEPGPGARGRAHRGFSRARPHNPRSRSCCPSLGAGYPAHGPSIAAIPFPTTVTCAQNPTKDWLVLDFRKRIFERRRSTGSTVCDVHRLFVRKKRVHRRITRNA